MKQTLQLRLGQQLTMTPQLQQAIRLLQLSAIELTLEVQQALDSNMMLELAEDDAAGEDAEKPSSDTLETTGSDEALGAEEDVASEQIPEELPVDTVWDDIYTGMSSGSAAGDLNGFEFENQSSSTGSLRENLLWQINLAPMSESDRVIAMAIIDAINEDGYLTLGSEELRETLRGDVSMEEIEAVIRQVQTLEPTGVGARDLKECLSLQLEQMYEADCRWLPHAKRLGTL